MGSSRASVQVANDSESVRTITVTFESRVVAKVFGTTFQTSSM
jgi:hypothetical protein